VISLNRTEDYFDQLIEVLAPQGKLALIDEPETILDIRKLKQKSLSLHWELMFTRSMFKTEDMIQQRELVNRVAELVDAGKIRTTIGTHYGAICAENLIKAHQDIENGKAIGKIVLESFA
ncbi:NADPH:quinone reductase, partial [Oceanospirillum linum]